MGVDLISKSGATFSRSFWVWRPLWNYVSDATRLSRDRWWRGQFNDGESFNASQATYMARTLLNELTLGHAQKAVHELEALKLQEPKSEQCGSCNGTGVVEAVSVEFKPCGACLGSGWRTGLIQHYSLTETDIKELAQFMLHSNGFEIR